MARKATTRRPRKKITSNTNWPEYNLRFDPDDLRDKLKIDKYALDEMVEQQPEIFGEVAEAAALAKSQVDSLSEQMKELEAEIDKQTREDAYASDERITENEIKAVIAGSPQRKALMIRIIEAQNMQRRLDALTTAFRHRSYAMRDMVDLYLASYYSSSSAKGAREDQREAEVERITTRMGERRYNRTKRNRKRTQ